MAPRHLEPQATLHPRGRARAGRSPSARRLTLCAAAVVTALMAAAAAQAAPAPRIKAPILADIARASVPIPDTLISRPKTEALALAPAG